MQELTTAGLRGPLSYRDARQRQVTVPSALRVQHSGPGRMLNQLHAEPAINQVHQVQSADELVKAFASNARDIEITRHLDLRGLHPSTELSEPLFVGQGTGTDSLLRASSLRSLRVCSASLCRIVFRHVADSGYCLQWSTFFFTCLLVGVPHL